MNEHSPDRLKDTLAELYRIDPELKQFEADLPVLITTLKQHQPTVSIDEAFARSLRASLLAAAPTQLPSPASVPSPYVWWAIRLSPVGIALFLFIVLSPEQAYMPTDEYFADSTVLPEEQALPAEDVADTARSKQVATNEPQPEAAPAELGDVSIMASDPTSLTMDVPEPVLIVEPPLPGDTLSIASVTVPEAGWIVVYEDEEGAYGDILATERIGAGLHETINVTLNRTLEYPELITVVVYTATNSERFSAPEELIQIDPLSGVVLVVTVPVISELEASRGE